MTLSLTLAAGFMAVITYVTLKFVPKKKEAAFGGFLILALALALALRLVIGYTAPGYPWDMGLFKAWGQLCNEVGYGGAYFSEIYLDYPPTYLYVLSFIDGLRGLFNLAYDSQAYELLIKLPSILADLGIGFVLYRLCIKKFSGSYGVLAACLYLFCPAVIMNSAVWGQIESICTILMLGSLLCLKTEKYIPSAILYGIAVATKPQMLIFAPVYFFFTVYKKKFLQLGISLLIALGTVMLLATPFIKDWDYLWLIGRYSETVNGYLYYSINAYNFWGLIGYNWKALPDSTVINFILDWGIPVIATAVTGLFMYKKREAQDVFTASALILSTVFIFGIKMHERYLFPALVFILVAWILKGDKRFLIAFGGLTSANLLNTAYAYIQGSDYVPPTDPLLLFISAVHVSFYIYFVYAVITPAKERAQVITKNQKGKNAKVNLAGVNPIGVSNLRSFFGVGNKPDEPATDKKLYRLDYILVVSITAVYAVFAFWNLGSNAAANTSWTPVNGEEAVFEIQGDYDTMTYVCGISKKDNNYYRVGHQFKVETSADGSSWQAAGELLQEDDSYVYDWNELSFESPPKFVKITSKEDDLVLNEIGFKDRKGYKPVNLVAGSAQSLIDEQQVVPMYPSYYNSMYFDEIYHARTAYEHLEGVEVYENTHPTLGKLIIAFFINIFGMNPFGWRFAGALFGVLMLPVLYFIAKRLFGSSFLSCAAVILFAFDFMHFTQTRIATIDTYAVFFTLLMYAAMLVFVQKDIMKSSIKALILPLALSGVFFGLGAAAKWTCIYGGAGLAALYFWKLYREYSKNKSDTLNKSQCVRRICDLCLWSILLFILVPFGIYFAAFLPLTTLPHNSKDIFGSFISYQQHMFSYHSGLHAEHYFASPWYEWPLAIRNIWYSSCSDFDGTGAVSSISCLGNPLLWWPGLAGLLFTLWQTLKKRLIAPVFIVLGFGAMYLPWVLVPRLTFVYHYFTAVPFIILGLMYLAHHYSSRGVFSKVVFSRGTLSITRMQLIVCLFIAVNLIMFAVFYPVLSGAPTTKGYIDSLEWLPNWYLG